MNTKKFSSNLSLPMIQENLKRFWVGSLLAFLGYFFLGTLLIIFSQTYGETDPYMVRSLLEGTWPPYVLILFLVPPVAALLIYKYMQQQSSTAIMNALPFSRKMLFHSNFLSGAILCIAPILLNGIILLLIAKPTMISILSPEGVDTIVDVFTAANIFRMTMLYTIITLLLYGIAMFAATVTGSSLVQFLLSFGFVFLFPAVILCVNAYNSKYLYGYQMPELFESLLRWTCPAMGLAMQGITYKLMVWYFLCFLVVYLATYLLYQRRKMEKATDTIAFNFLKPIFKYLITFLGMTLMAFMFGSFGRGGLFFVGAAAGALLGYVISDMIVQKSFRIRGFVKGFGVYAVLAVLFFGAYFVDITGYETRLPEGDEVASVSLNVFDFIGRRSDYYNASEEITDPAAIKEIIAFHEDITGTADQEESFQNSMERTDYQRMTYRLKNGKEMVRGYSIPFSFYSVNEHLDRLFQTDNFKECLYPILKESTENAKDSSFILYPSGNNGAFGTTSVSLTKEESREFIECLKKDLQAETFEEKMQYLSPVCYLEIRTLSASEKASCQAEMAGSQVQYYEDESYIMKNYDIMPYDENAIGWLKAHGYYNLVALTPEDITRAEVYVYSITERDGEVSQEEPADQIPYGGNLMVDKIYSEEVSLGTITDPAQIQQVLDTGQWDYINYYEYYRVALYSDGEEADYGIDRYYNLNRAPDFIKNM